MIKVYFCPSINSWEVDYISELFVDAEHFELMAFQPMEMVEEQEEPSVLVASHGLALFNVQYLVKTLRPKVVLHLSDEAGTDQPYYDLYSENAESISFLYHQYNHLHLNYKLPHSQLPLGYVSGMIPQCTQGPNCRNAHASKQHTFAFVGQIKSDRQEMLDVWKEAFGCSCVEVSKTDWSNPRAQLVDPKRLGDLYAMSWFVPVGRGNRSLDCFRIYEAIVSGAIPVVRGYERELKETFAYGTEGFTLVTAESWEEARDKCALLLADEEKMCNIIDTNLRWWASINEAIVKTVCAQFE
jgi:hypothetical protein